MWWWLTGFPVRTMHCRFARWAFRIPHNRLPCVCRSKYLGFMHRKSLSFQDTDRTRPLIDCTMELAANPASHQPHVFAGRGARCLSSCGGSREIVRSSSQGSQILLPASLIEFHLIFINLISLIEFHLICSPRGAIVLPSWTNLLPPATSTNLLPPATS